ncbi:MAG: Lrp/AsnC family transcriptional regulator [Nanobdellota archaeon]
MVDDIDTTIIAQLRKDGRRSYADIARDCGLNTMTIMQRVSCLKQQGIIKRHTISHAPERLGYVSGSVLVRTKGNMDAVISFLTNQTVVSSISAVTGRYDILFDLICGDEQEFSTFMSTFHSTCPINKTEVFFRLQTIQ